MGALLAAVRWGWLGPDVGRGDGFCEAAGDGWVKQPANSWSNLAFVVAGLAIGWRAGRPDGRFAATPRLTTAYAIAVTLLGPASMAMHATQSDLGGRLDLFSMYLLAGFAFSYALMRVRRAGMGTFAFSYAACLIAGEVVENLDWSVPVVHNGADLAFAVMLIGAVTLEGVLIARRDSLRDTRFGYAAVATLLLAFGIWNLAQTGRIWCQPASLLQGHAAWHTLDAVAAYLLYRYWASETAPTSGDSR